MSFFTLFFSDRSFWFRTIALGVLLGVSLVQGDNWLHSRSSSYEKEVTNAPASLALDEFLPHASQAKTNASYLFQEVLLKNPPEEVAPLVPPTPHQAKSIPPKLPFYEKYVPVPKKVSPNSIRLARSQAPLPVSAKKVNGQWVCANKNDKPGKSDKNKRAHIDRQCCLDPDEVPNPHCTY